MSWAADEFAELDLGDERRNRRLRKLAETFARQPMAAIPAACGGWADTQAAYRFFAHESLDWRDILAPHWQCTAMRANWKWSEMCVIGWLEPVPVFGDDNAVFRCERGQSIGKFRAQVNLCESDRLV